MAVHITLDRALLWITLILGVYFLNTQIGESSSPHAANSCIGEATPLLLQQLHASHISLGLILLIVVVQQDTYEEYPSLLLRFSLAY